MTTLTEILLGMFAVGLQAALVYFIAPPRIGVVGNLVDDENGRPLLRLAIQSLETRETVGPFTVMITPVRPGGLRTDVRSIKGYVGTQHDWERLSVEESSLGVVTVRVGAIRPTKTWVLEFPCVTGTTAFDCHVSGARRRLSLLFPVLDEVALGDIKPGTFEFGFAIARRVGADAREAEGPPRAFYGQGRVFFTVLLFCLTSYSLLVLWLDPHVHEYSWLWDALPPLGITAVISVHFVLIRPRWPVVAQGYLEPWDVPVQRSTAAAQRGLDQT